MFLYKLGIIGAGNMSNAITRGILAGGVLKPSEVIVSDIDAKKLEGLKAEGFAVTSDNGEAASRSKSLLFAVKPQCFKEAADGVRPCLAARSVISIMAGISTAALRQAFGDSVGLCRIMPNTPCVIGRGISALTFVNYSAADKAFVFDIFDKLGETVELPEEKFDAVTAVSGSGPAYVYTFLDAVIKGGVKNGLTEDEAKRLAVSVFKGAAELAALSDKPLDALIKDVTSKGGTTEAALNAFAKNGVADGITEGVSAAAARSKELGGR
ncbi:MAG: pyrroline-5-carboxylate reductase [Clostridiales bacterium]|jgi:pyrroline-5-carboxylate reductase|nr:pyrroline-5-carboxylate reductase [Clostridiales bacterium]